MSRKSDWLEYSEELLEIGTLLLKNGKHTWSCFTYQQSSAAALKAILSKLGESTFGDNLIALLRTVDKHKQITNEVKEACHTVNNYFKSTRDLESHSEGTPSDFYTEEDAVEAKHCAHTILRFAHQASH